ncbi:MAG: hypothetical protein U5K51_14450 [Flavobacteriaceae bacterium]|nr:hypothetical protein [Flavobacteriaceae bacterium]
MIYWKLIIFLCLTPLWLYCQDTTFVKKHFFNNPVRNVFNGPDGIYVKTGDGLYMLKEDLWILKGEVYTKKFVFFDKQFFESDYVPNNYLANIGSMKELIPQRALSEPTLARLENKLFVAVAGNLYEYFINTSFMHTFDGYSIRNIYFDKDISVISTYNGIFINDSLKAESPKYASGSFQKINDRYFLCSDLLFEMTEFGKFTQIDITDVNISGHFRKLLKWNNEVISLNTRSINIWNPEIGLLPLHRGDEYNDMEIVANKLIFCTSKGQVLQYSNKKFTTLCSIQTRIRDLYEYGEILYICSDAGLYTLEKLAPESLKKQNKLPNIVGVSMDFNKNLWIATEAGLYVQPEKEPNPITFIPNIEFKRAALTIYDDHVYAGSVQGIFIIDIFNVSKNFLPQYINEVDVGYGNILLYTVIFLLILSALVVSLVRHRKKIKNKVIVNTTKKNEETILTIDQMEQDIISQRIMTVEGLAEFYKTNSVQLNRILKSYNTTPENIKTDKVKTCQRAVKE